MKPFMPPKNDDIDYNPLIDAMIEEEIERGLPSDEDFDIRDEYDDEDADDLRNINIG
jgi:hypothetical protein